MNKTFIFDLDNTLIPEYQFLFRKLVILMATVYPNTQIEKDFLSDIYFSQNRDSWVQSFCKHYKLPFTFFIYQYRLILRDRTKSVLVEIPQQVIRCVKNLDSDRKFAGIITNGNPMQQLQKIDQLSMQSGVYFVTSFPQSSKPKPHPFSLIEMMQIQQLDSRNCVYVGDSTIDYAFAKNSGVQFMSAGSFFNDDIQTYGWNDFSLDEIFLQYYKF